MLIIGAKGFAKEVLEVIHQQGIDGAVAFYDDVNTFEETLLYNRFRIIQTLEEAQKFLAKNDHKFALGIGSPYHRKVLSDKFTAMGGKLSSTISPHARVGGFGNTIADGCNIMTGTVITNDISLGTGCLINLNCTIGHDCVIGSFVEMSPGVHISGNVSIGDYTVFGTNAAVLPGVNIGKNVTIGAGAVVTKDLKDNEVAVGVPAKVIKVKDSIRFE